MRQCNSTVNVAIVDEPEVRATPAYDPTSSDRMHYSVEVVRCERGRPHPYVPHTGVDSQGHSVEWPSGPRRLPS